jgi:hypothetical protein
MRFLKRSLFAAQSSLFQFFSDLNISRVRTVCSTLHKGYLHPTEKGIDH